MELSSHQEGQGQIPISIPIPINTSFGGHAHLGHVHHHHHQAPSSTLTHTLIHNSHISSAPPVVAPPPPPQETQIIYASINNNASSIPTRSTTSPNQEEEDEEDHEDHDEHANIVNNVTYTHINNSSNNNNKVVKNIKYKECLKNHAASIGGNATDGCGEFMPSGAEGTIEALNCSACNCHRNFHRKETQSETKTDPFGRKVLLGLHPNVHNNKTNNLSIVPSRTAPHHFPHMILSYNTNMGMGGLVGTHFPAESDEQEQDQAHHHNYHGGPPLQVVKKRYRTKFTQEQKEKMFSFAEKVGWKIQKQEESVVQSFCHEIGVKRRVLKVWMHNNKHNLVKNNNKLQLPQPSTNNNTTTTTTTNHA